MDLEHTHARLIAAFKGIAEGKGLGDTVIVPPLGTTTKIFHALNDAVKHLDETFAADDLELVDQAFKKIDLTRTSDKKNDAARATLKALVPSPGTGNE